MKRKPILIKLLLSLIGLLGVTTANAQVNDLTDLPTAIAAYCSGEQVKLTASPAGAASYIWKRYEGNVVGGTAVTLAGTTANLVDVPPSSGYYTYVSTSVNAEGCESTVSDPAVIYALPGITAALASNTPATTQYCTNAVPTGLTLTATPGEATSVAETFEYTYKWYKNGVVIAGATTNSYTLNSTDDSAVGANIAYTVEINYAIKTCTAATSTPINFNVIALPTKPTISITL